jgi:small subunit ribosomal protein S20
LEFRKVANHKSALKRFRQTAKRRLANKHIKSTTRSLVRDARDAVEGKSTDTAQTAVRQAQAQLNRAASKGIIPKRRASRQVARLNKALQRMAS